MSALVLEWRRVDAIRVGWVPQPEGPAIPAAIVGPPGASGTGGSGGVTAVSATAPITSSGGTTPDIGIAAATTSVRGTMSAADKTKLDGVANGATANDTDANLKARANHTGTQTASTIADFAAAADARIAAAGNLRTATLSFVIDGGGAAIAAGIKGDLEIPFGCTITGWTLLADQTGSAVIDVWKDSYANYPPVGGDSITASAKPALSSATKAQSSTLTGWTTSITAGDTLRFNVDSASHVQRLTVSLKVTKS